MRTCVIFFLAVILLYSCQDNSIHADLIIMNGKIMTMDAEFSEVKAMATKGNTILATGSVEDIIVLKRSEHKNN